MFQKDSYQLTGMNPFLLLKTFVKVHGFQKTFIIVFIT